MRTTPAIHPIRCRCGTLQGELRHPDRSTRAVCYCRDCQAYARFLGLPPGMLDAQGGTDVVVVRPRQVAFTAGRAKLACMSLSPRGTLRWYACCCRTPIGNTPRDVRIAHVSLVHDALEGGGASLDAVFGPVRMRVNAQSAHGPVPRNSPLALVPAMLGYVAGMAWSRLSGGYRHTPFFDAQTQQPVVAPQVITKAERAALRGDDSARPPA